MDGGRKMLISVKIWLFYEDLENKAFLGTRILTKHKRHPTKMMCNTSTLGGQQSALRGPNTWHSCHVCDRWADPSYQTPPRSSALEFCAQLKSRQYHGITFPTAGSTPEPAVLSILQ